MPYDKDELRPEIRALFDELDPKGLERLDDAIARWRGKPTALLHVLHAAQEIFTWLPKGVLERVSRGLDLPRAEVFGYATFFDHFHTDGPAKHCLRVCQSVSCHLQGSGQLLAAAGEALGVGPGERTADGAVRFEAVSCLGQCDHAPGVSIDDEPLHDATAEVLKRRLAELRRGE